MKKERPILFSTPMVQAVLNGTKTQTRRIIKPQPYVDKQGNWVWKNINFGQSGKDKPCIQDMASSIPYRVLGTNKTGIHNPYGKVGDELWVRETWGAPYCDHPRCEDGTKPKKGDKIVYLADDADCYQWDGFLPWRPSIHMYRWASRIQLRITDIRVERLQDISEHDAHAEGILRRPHTALKNEVCYMDYQSMEYVHAHNFWAKQSFQSLWDSINGNPRKDGTDISWKSNPWVWVVEFEVIKP